jgi:hypothetical protein
MCLLELAIRFFSELFIRYKDNFMFYAWVRRIHQLLRDNVQGSTWLLTLLWKKRVFFEYLFIRCPSDKARLAFARIVDDALRCLAPLEREHYQEQFIEV